MAEEIIGSVALENLIKLLVYEANLLAGVEDQVGVLRHDLGIMNAFLKDSAGKHKESHLVKELMDQTNKVALEAEDVIDVYVAMILKQGWKNWFGKLFLCFGHAKMLHHLANKTTMINKVIRSINDNKASYSIREIEASFDVEAAFRVHRRRRKVEEDDVVGFLDNIKELVDQLIHQGVPDCDVISIIGMGGLGKTTLAKQIYKDPSVRRSFNCFAWVEVSQVYNIRKLFLDILKCLIPRDENYRKTVEDLQKMYVDDLELELYEKLNKKRYFIVMDDVWKPQVWEDVKAAFPDNKNGSRIIITSRNKEVASYASVTPPYFLSKLDPDASWSLLSKKVFRGGECPEDMKACGMKLSAGCRGLPLSIVALGGILANKVKSQRTWSDILDSKVNSFLTEDGEQCLTILALSYNQLPYKLKSCFLYFGVFPEDCDISTTDLINLWISEGLIEEIGNRKVEAVAENYLEQLIDRSLIEVVSMRSDGRVKTCRIHDLLRDFCVSQSIKEKFYEVHSEGNNLSSRIKPARRLSVHCNKVSEYLKSSSSYETSSSRSVLLFSQESESIDEKDWVRLFQFFKFIRVLFLSEVSTSIAGSSLKQIEKLTYLRYFAIKLKERYLETSTSSYLEIPNSICKLRYLETIGIRLRVLWPKNVWRMTQLRHLSAYPMRLLPEPQKKGADHQLFNLQVLSDLHVDRKTAGFIENKFPNLTKLGLFYDDKENHDGMEIPEMTAILVSLEKLPHLQRLRITGFPQCQRRQGKIFPSTLYKVALYKSYVDSYLMKILGKLPNLRVLKIKDSSNLSPGRLDVLAGEFAEMEVFKMDSYEIETWEMEDKAMPKLQHLFISRNSTLKTLPDELWSSTSHMRQVELSHSSTSLKESIRRSSFCRNGGDSRDSDKVEFNMTNGCKVSMT